MRWLIALLLVGSFLFLLYALFPQAAPPPGDGSFGVVYYSIWLLPVTASALALRGKHLSQALRHALAWLAIILVLVLGYSFRDEISGSRLAAELMPSRARIAADGSLSVRAGSNGHFHLDAQVNGATVRFLVDTGASDIMLSPQDAARAGYNPERLRYTRTYSTANGIVGGAPVTIGTLTVGPVKMSDIAASVNGGATEESLLGMHFLKQFRSYRVESGTLTLVP